MNPILTQVKLPYVSDTNCQEVYGSSFKADQMCCAGDVVNGGLSTCQVCPVIHHQEYS